MALSLDREIPAGVDAGVALARLFVGHLVTLPATSTLGFTSLILVGVGGDMIPTHHGMALTADR